MDDCNSFGFNPRHNASVIATVISHDGKQFLVANWSKLTKTPHHDEWDAIEPIRTDEIDEWKRQRPIKKKAKSTNQERKK
jgi:hypothetical protein